MVCWREDADEDGSAALSGRVQGVGYRAWAIAAAARLGLRGWVRNRADGSVELLASGPAHAIASLLEACRSGPSAARVDRVDVVDATDDGSTDFAARPNR